ncbi:ABC transporter permease [Lacihabitans sp. LS3-19]|uniref:ABC transporter permease n=1 Tax=Lacihabitans sp. LS3-19 TaxID=2487335 RepID=UPI0020CC14D2|nr:ABC transporter permease [Lacihabitans sp. LS3-19]MCP9766514.1 ABC transporter permease [Lacihabitans sp. LS3-19]
MFKRYFSTSWRHIAKNKSFSLINITGLSLGIVSATLIFLWIEHTYHYNRILPDSENLYQVKNNQAYGDDTYTMSATSGPLGPVLDKEVPGIKESSRIMYSGGVFGFKEKNISFEGVYADSNFFSLFKFPFIDQLDKKWLGTNDRVVISKKMAEAIFGSENPIGKSVSLNKSQNFVVSGVFEHVSENMTMNPEWVISLGNQFLNDDFKTTWSHWGTCGMRTYVLLNQGVDYQKVNTQIKNLISNKSGGKVNHSVFLYPYTKLGWYNTFKNGLEIPSEGSIKFVKLFFIIAIIILLIACINFMNLSTAKSEKRAKEIGLKKAIGISKRELIVQFFAESTLISLFSVAVSIILLFLLVPVFGQMIDVPLKLNLFQPTHILYFALIGIFCGLLAGTYPAFFLSSFNPIEALNRKIKGNPSSQFIRKGLVVFQFSISIVIIIATIVVSNQINHTKNRDLGFNKDRILMLPVSTNLTKSFDLIRSDLKNSETIHDAAMTFGTLFNMYSNGGGFHWKGHEETKDELITFNGITPNYLDVVGIKIAQGRGFYENVDQEKANVIINPALAKFMGKEGKVGGVILRGNDPPLTVVGITQDFVFNDVYGIPEPLILFPNGYSSFPDYGSIAIKLTDNQPYNTQIEAIKNKFAAIDPDYPFNYQFLDDTFNAKFQSILFVGKLVLLFSFLSIAISCLGLFGLSAFMAQQRTKEIGVRKVLGATVSQIIGNLTVDFLKLIIVAFVLATPLAYYLMNQWLDSYTYRTALHGWMFLLAGGIALVITFFTVGYQAFRAANVNPIRSLKTE